MTRSAKTLKKILKKNWRGILEYSIINLIVAFWLLYYDQSLWWLSTIPLAYVLIAIITVLIYWNMKLRLVRKHKDWFVDESERK